MVHVINKPLCALELKTECDELELLLSPQNDLPVIACPQALYSSYTTIFLYPFMVIWNDYWVVESHS